VTRLWVLSDLHLEAVPFPDGYDPVRPEFDVLVAAGDLWRGEPEKAVATLNRLAGGRPAVFVAGNHEACGLTSDQTTDEGVLRPCIMPIVPGLRSASQTYLPICRSWWSPIMRL